MLLNSTVLMSDANHFTNDAPINPYYDNSVIDIARAQIEHDNIKAALQKAGVEVKQVPSPIDCQDGVYTANWALVRGETAVLARLPDARKDEESYAEKVLQHLGKTVLHVPEDWHFSGQGDALPCGELLFCGSRYRSDERAQKFAAETLGFRRIQLQTIPEIDTAGKEVINKSSGWADSFFYDIDLALSILRAPSDTKKGLIAYCPEAFTEKSQKNLAELDEVEKITLSLKEAQKAFACNLVSTGETIIMSAHAPVFSRKLQAHGFALITPEVQELAKGGGYIRCTTLSLV